MANAEKTAVVTTEGKNFNLNRPQLILLTALSNVWLDSSDDEQAVGMVAAKVRLELDDLGELPTILNGTGCKEDDPLQQNAVILKEFKSLPDDIVLVEEAEDSNHPRIHLMMDEVLDVKNIPDFRELDDTPIDFSIPDISGVEGFSSKNPDCIFALLGTLYILLEDLDGEEIPIAELVDFLEDDVNYKHLLEGKDESTRRKNVGRWVGFLNHAGFIRYENRIVCAISARGRAVLRDGVIPEGTIFAPSRKTSSVKKGETDEELIARLLEEKRALLLKAEEKGKEIARVLERQKEAAEASLREDEEKLQKIERMLEEANASLV